MRWSKRVFGLASLLSLLGGCDSNAAADGAPEPGPGAAPGGTVRVRLIGPDGRLGEPVEVKRVVLSDAEWKRRLTKEQYAVARAKGTERPFCGGLLDNKEKGVYVCVCCGLPLFESSAKFHSGTGWPSFFQPIAPENVLERRDTSHGMVRTEIVCARCDAHLGHVFEDGPPPTGRRHCLNGVALRFVKEAERASLAESAEGTAGAPAAGAAPAPAPSPAAQRAEAVFAGGCFWCVEAVFEEIDGVIDVVSGYAGGSAETANYKAVCTGTTGHAEAVKIVYDPAKVSYEQLLRVHFATHDPTTKDRQGADQGPQYRSAIFYATEEERAVARAFIDDLTAARAFPAPIVTTLEPLVAFYPAEAYHQDYAACNPGQPYIRAVALPKVAKVREKFKDMLKRPAER